MMTILLVIAILVLLIVAHELGHFIVAKIFRVRVEEFGIGYPPRAFTFGKLGHTEYTLNWIPFGGFVRLFGEDGEKKRGRGSFVDAHRAIQASILIAGVVANVIVAWGLFAMALHAGIPQLVNAPVPGEPSHLIASGIIPASPADSAGIKPGDEIIAVTDEKGETTALLPSAVVDFVKARGGKPISIVYIHAGAQKTATIISANAVLPHAGGQPALGIALALVGKRSLPWSEAAIEALYQTRGAFILVSVDLWRLTQGALHGAPDISEVVGPVGIVSYVGEASQNGFGSVLLFAAIISVNLAIINLIPIPALDGGRLAILLVESIMRRAAPRLLVQMLNAIGIALIILLMVTVTYHDIARLF